MTASTLRVGFGLRPGDPFWVQVREAVQQRADELGLSLVPVNMPSGRPSGDTYLELLEELKAQELGALISHADPESLLLAILNEGLPVVCSEDTLLIRPHLVSVHGLDRAAVMAADFVAERLAGQGRVLVVGASGDHSQTALLRLQGFERVFSRFPGLQSFHVGASWRYDQTIIELLDEAEQWLPKMAARRVDAVIGLSDSLALAGRDAGRRLGIVDEQTLVVGINGDPLAIAAIEAGAMHATVETSAQELGFRLAEFSRRAARHEPLPDHFPYAFELVTAANVAQVAVRKLVAIADLPSRLVDVNLRQEQQRLVQMATSLALNQQVGSILDQQELLAAMAEIIGTHYDYDRVLFFIWSNSERAFTLAQGAEPGDEQREIPLAAAGALAAALLHNQTIYIPDTFNSKRYAPDPRWPDVASRVLLPVRVGGRILGVLDLHSRQRSVRNQVELDALQTLADELGTAMRNAQLYAQAVEARAGLVQENLLKARLLANVSHQMQTAVQVILGANAGALAVLNRQPSLPSGLQQHLRAVQRSSADLQRQIDDLTSLAQVEMGALRLNLEPIEARTFFQEVFDMAAAPFANGSEVRWRLQAPAQLPTLLADPARLRTVLLNLLANAARFTRHGQIILGVEAVDAQLHFWVQDTGCGIEPSALAGLLQQLVIGSSPVGGHTSESSNPGLGLTIVRQLIVRHGGDLQIESDPGRGTTCHVRLPLTAGASEVATQSAARREDSTGPVQPDRVSEKLVAKTCDYVASNFASPLTRNDIAAALGVSPEYVSRVFRRHTGMALWDYVNGYRIARACDLLGHSDMTVTEIAFAVGFNDPAYFSRVFRKETGQSPASYRSAV